MTFYLRNERVINLISRPIVIFHVYRWYIMKNCYNCKYADERKENTIWNFSTVLTAMLTALSLHKQRNSNSAVCGGGNWDNRVVVFQ